MISQSVITVSSSSAHLDDGIHDHDEDFLMTSVTKAKWSTRREGEDAGAVEEDGGGGMM